MDVIGRFPVSKPSEDSQSDEDDPDPRSDPRFRSSYLPDPPTGLETPGLGGMYYQSRGGSKADWLAFFRSDTRMEFDFGSQSPAATISDYEFAIT